MFSRQELWPVSVSVILDLYMQKQLGKKVFIFLAKPKTDEERISDGDNAYTGQRVMDQNAQSNLFFKVY